MEPIYLMSSLVTCDTVWSQLHKDLSGSTRLVCIASTPNESVSNDGYYKDILTWFDAHQIQFESTILLDARIEMQRASQYLKNADVIFLMGGDTLLQNVYLTQLKFLQHTQNSKAMVLGMSAGAINCAHTSFYEEREQIKQMRGMGLCEISVFPHFDISREKDRALIRRASHICPVYGLDETSVIRVAKEYTQMIGSIYCFD